MDERQPKPALADDPSFLASLSDLDQGLSGGQQPSASNVQRFPQPQPAPPQPPLASHTASRPAPASIAPPPRAAQSPPPRSVGSLSEPPAWLPPGAVAAINAASAALSAAFDAPPSAPGAAAPPAPAPAQPGAAGSRRTLLDLFPPPASRDATAPSLAIRDVTTAPPIAAAEPPRVAGKTRAFPSLAEPRVAAVTYETFYGLDETPFSATPDLRFLYHGSAHDRVLQELLSSVGKHDAVAVLTGPPGIGKTMLCRALVDQLDRRTLVSFVADTVASGEDLLKALLIDFGVISTDDVAAGKLASATHEDLTGALRDFLGSLGALHASALLIVDEAHRLPQGVLRELRGIADIAASHRLLQIVLAGEPTLTKQLRSEDLRGIDERVALRVALGPLEEDEVPGYVAHRLAVAGRGERIEFSEPAFGRVFSLSRGVPGVVNQICDRALALGYQSSASRIDGDFVDEAAQQLGLSSADAGVSWRDRALIAVLMIALMLAGAAGAGWVFREQLSRAWVYWHGGGPSTSSTPR